jgi:ABC-type uncharacterized transport system auxiliary subunit
VLEVDRFRAEALTGERPILYRHAEEGAEVRRHAYHRWVDSPTRMVQSQVARYLRAAGVAEAVVTPEMRANPDFVLSGTLVRLERVIGAGRPGVVVALQLGVVRESDHHLVFQRGYRSEREADGDAVADSADALNAALTEICRRIVADLSAAEAEARSPTPSD